MCISLNDSHSTDWLTWPAITVNNKLGVISECYFSYNYLQLHISRYLSWSSTRTRMWHEEVGWIRREILWQIDCIINAQFIRDLFDPVSIVVAVRQVSHIHLVQQVGLALLYTRFMQPHAVVSVVLFLQMYCTYSTSKVLQLLILQQESKVCYFSDV